MCNTNPSSKGRTSFELANSTVEMQKLQKEKPKLWPIVEVKQEIREAKVRKGV